jgi:hypothetical protein
MKPTPSDVHVNTPLTMISVAYRQSQDRFVADRIFPTVSVDKQSDRYYSYDRGAFNRDQMQLRSPATESAGIGYSVDASSTYYCPQWSLHADVADEVRANADSVLNIDRDMTELLTLQALIRREKAWAAKYFVGGVWTSDFDGVASGNAWSSSTVLQWNDANSTPIEDIRKAQTTILERTGYMPNVLTLGKPVYDALIDHPDLVDRIKYGQTPGSPAVVNKQALAALFEVERVEVMSAIENTAAEGATNVHSFIGGKKAFLCYAAPSPGLMTPTAGYTFLWRGLYGGAGGQRIRRFRLESIAADRIEIDMCFDQKLVAADLGFFFDAAVA